MAAPMKRDGTTIFALDLDGTVTRREILPLVADELGFANEIALLTRMVLQGTMRFEQAFRLSVEILRSIPISRVQKVVGAIPLDKDIEAFIGANRSRCAIVTGNLDCWIAPLVDRLGCTFYASVAATQGDTLVGIRSVQNRTRAIQTLRKRGRVIAIGQTLRDLPMFEEADANVAYGGLYDPPESLLGIADFVTYESGALCQLLATLS
jgi:HAD superfamily phosphoserine phosphatase-like hydrolase